ncbi:unnamed protein product [Rotaria sordida]|uniref:Uncharacterized protein n=1 Tax=Rotaria sordida TaxID=392033 RepID=A0A820DLN2_9BILA|nr:unnamed protein product [Rotaria sordida]CAF4234174.1 unnamed protein product [Rotaria sordida]
MDSSIKNESRIAYCNGRACPLCHKCLDWYSEAEKHRDCDYDSRSYAHHLGPLVSPLYRWRRRVDATCGY